MLKKNQLRSKGVTVYLSNLKCFQIEKPKRKSARQQVMDAEKALLDKILSELRNKKRSIPKEWERGFNSAMSAVELFKDE